MNLKFKKISNFILKNRQKRLRHLINKMNKKQIDIFDINCDNLNVTGLKGTIILANFILKNTIKNKLKLISYQKK